MEVLIDNRQNIIEIDNDTISLMEKAIRLCLQKENLSLDIEVSVSFVDNDEIRYLNKVYRGKDKATDVLSFPQYEDTHDQKKLYFLGDIVISLERAQEQADEYGHSFTRELIFLTVHSMFHLMGYDHDTKENTIEMRSKEEEVMNEMGILRE